MGVADKTVWDWLNLSGTLAIPLVVVGATIAFGIIQADLAQKQHDSDQALANQQHAADQQQALDQQRATILQTYIDNIQDLLLNHNLLKSKPTDDIAILARARTLTALRGLDGSRKGVLIQFLYEANLIGFSDYLGNPQPSIINLSSADLSGANLSFVDLNGADLRFANLSSTDLIFVALASANLSGATLSGATLSKANLSNASLSWAHLGGADLGNAYLDSADLSNATLSKANLSSANLSSADLSDANLSGANLSGADLIRAIVTPEQLAGVKSLKGATMPDGSKHP